MRRSSAIAPAGSYDETAVLASVELDYDQRHRRRIVLTAGRLQILLDLAKATHLKDGDGLILDGGGIVRVTSAPEKLVEITATSTAELVRVAWHLGNRHLPTQLLGDRLRIRYDHVIVDMLRGLKAEAEVIEAPFDPEGGAYGHGEVQGHDHGHSHDHGHDHDCADHGCDGHHHHD